ncbi:MAG: hypothetical protein KA521_08190 [Crocinitomicaceae bacterium]|nr:hypothetical protein [Crocinitomicaceae bacterium]
MTKSYSEIIIKEQPDNSLFKRLADRIVFEFKAKIIEKINDLDSAYWDFQVKSEIITLHQQTYIGISVYPKDLDKASIAANQLAEKIAFKLKYSDSNYDNWIVLKYGAQIEIQYLLENIIEARLEKGKYIQKQFSDTKYATYGHEHCEICQVTISGEDVAYFGETHSVCVDCFDEYIETDDYINRLEKLDKIVKTK